MSPTRLERRLWFLAAALVVVGYALIVPAQTALNALRSRGLLAKTVLAVFALAAIGLFVLVLRSRPRPSEWVLYGAAMATYALILPRLEVVQERVHFLQYGVLAGVLYLALRVRAGRLGSPRRWSSATIAALLTALVGWGDEGIQALVPSRVYDLRDIGFNALAGILAVLTLTLRETLRQDRQAISTASE